MRYSFFSLILCFQTSVAISAELTVFGAASLMSALDAVNTAFAQQHRPVKANYAPASTLARQIEQGAEADIFISANVDWMDYLDDRNLLNKSTRFDLLRNELVLIAPKTRELTLSFSHNMDLVSLLNGGRLTLGDPSHIPFGMYAKQSFEHFNLWKSLEPHIAYAENVRVALALVAREEAALGVVYLSDTIVEPNVHVVARFPSESHDPILYPVAKLSDSRHPDALIYLDFLRSESAHELFQQFGFSPIR